MCVRWYSERMHEGNAMYLIVLKYIHGGIHLGSMLSSNDRRHDAQRTKTAFYELRCILPTIYPMRREKHAVHGCIAHSTTWGIMTLLRTFTS